MKPTFSASSISTDAPHSHSQTTVSDRDLAERVARGAPDGALAYDQLYGRYAKDILAFLRSRLPFRTSAEDVAQEVWILVFQKLKKFDGSNFRAWLYEIARNRAIDDLRRVNRRKEVIAAPFGDIVAGDIDEDERLVALRDCLQQLDGPFIKTLISFRLDGFSVEDLAQQEQIQVATIYTRIDRAKRQLNECVQRKLS